MRQSTSRGGIWGAPGQVLQRLVGCWRLERRIEGHGSMRGTARFAPLPEGWVDYREEGELWLASGERFDATRRYRFRAQPEGFAVFFDAAPPGLFHEIALEPMPDGGLKGRARHLCAADLYLTEYRFAPDGSFSVRHEVSGPRKDFAISTQYRRVADEGEAG